MAKKKTAKKAAPAKKAASKKPSRKKAAPAKKAAVAKKAAPVKKAPPAKRAVAAKKAPTPKRAPAAKTAAQAKKAAAQAKKAAADAERPRLKRAARHAALLEKQTKTYAEGVKQLQGKRYSKAASLFAQAAKGPDAGLRHRAEIHERIARQHLESAAPKLKTAEDHYNYAVGMINARRLQEADEHLDKALKMAPKAGHLHYAKAAVAGLRYDREQARSSLSKAIDLDPKNRILARHDADFASVSGDEQIAALLAGESEEPET